MRFTWLSNCPWTYTGYGTQTALFVPRIKRLGHDMAIISNWGHQGAPINWDVGVQVFGNAHHPFAMDVMYGHSRSWNAAALFTLMDTWVFDLDALRDLKWIPWFPIDTEPMPARIKEKIEQAFFRIAMSKYGQEQAQAGGLDSEYVPLGIDSKIYNPMEQKKARENMMLPEDKFMIGMVAMNKGNPSRKAFFQTIQAFAALKKKHSDVFLYLHTLDGTRSPEMVNLVECCNAFGLSYAYAYGPGAMEADVLFADQYRYALGYPPDIMAMMYSAMDVHALVTMGEGFGIPIIEAQACGVPVIVGDWTSMPELLFSGWKVDKKDTIPIFNNLAAFHYLPRPEAIAEQMESAYQAKDKKAYRKQARKGALAYDADKITDKYWKPVLEKIADKLQAEPVPVALERTMDVLR